MDWPAPCPRCSRREGPMVFHPRGVCPASRVVKLELRPNGMVERMVVSSRRS